MKMAKKYTSRYIWEEFKEFFKIVGFVFVILLSLNIITGGNIFRTTFDDTNIPTNNQDFSGENTPYNGPLTTGNQNGVAYVEWIHVETNVYFPYAVTDITIKFVNPSHTTDELVGFLYPQPENGFFSNFSLTINETTYYAQVIRVEDALQRFQQARENDQNAGIGMQESATYFSFYLNLAPSTNLTMQLRYESVLIKNLGIYTITIPLQTLYDLKPKNVDVQVTINSPFSIDSITLKTYALSFNNYIQDKFATLVSTRDFQLYQDLDLIIEVTLKPPGRNGVIYFQNNGTHEFFLYIISPTTTYFEELSKKIVFVIDTSGSMSGLKLSQAKDAFYGILDQLRASDKFNIITFDSEISLYSSELQPVDADSIANAKQWVQNLQARGSTNFNEAVLKAIDVLKSDSTDAVPIIVVLSDGNPTYGVTDFTAIRNNVKNANEGLEASLYTLGFGDDVSFEFLYTLSDENYGRAIKIEVDENAASKIKGFYNMISTPLLTNIQLQIPDVWVTAPHINEINLYQGSEMVLTGMVPLDETNHSIFITASTYLGNETLYPTEDTYPLSERFIPKLWANLRIGDLLEQYQYSLNAALTPLEREIVSLSLEYQIVSPFTAFYIDIPLPNDSSNTQSNIEYNYNNDYYNNDNYSAHSAASGFDFISLIVGFGTFGLLTYQVAKRRKNRR